MASLGDLVVGMRADIQNFERKMTKVERRLGRLEGKFRKVGSAVASVAGKIKGLVAAYAGMRFFGHALSEFTQFDDAMRMVGARSQATQNDLRKLTEIAEYLGRTTSHTATEIAEMMNIQAQAGFKPNQIGNLIEPTANLKRATGSDAATASEVIASTLRVFQMETKEATRIADAFTSATIESMASLTDLAGGMSYVGENVTSLGVSLEETLGFMAVLHNRNIKGERAGTALRRTFSTLAAEADRLSGVFNTPLKEDGFFVGVPEALRRINAATKNLEGAEKLRVFKEAFQLLGMEAALVMSDSVDQVDELVNKMGKAGTTAKDVAESMDAGFGGVLRRFKSAFSGFMIRLGRLMAAVVTPIIERITKMLNHMASDEVMGSIARHLESAMILVGNIISSISDGSAWEYLALTLENIFSDILYTLGSNLEMILKDAARMVRDIMTGKYDDQRDYFKASRIMAGAGLMTSDTTMENQPRLRQLEAIMEKNGAATAEAIRNMGLGDMFNPANKLWEVLGKEVFPQGPGGVELMDDAAPAAQAPSHAGAAMLRGSMEAWQAQFSQAKQAEKVAKDQLAVQKDINKNLEDFPQQVSISFGKVLADNAVGIN